MVCVCGGGGGEGGGGVSAVEHTYLFLRVQDVESHTEGASCLHKVKNTTSLTRWLVL